MPQINIQSLGHPAPRPEKFSKNGSAPGAPHSPASELLNIARLGIWVEHLSSRLNKNLLHITYFIIETLGQN